LKSETEFTNEDCPSLPGPSQLYGAGGRGQTETVLKETDERDQNGESYSKISPAGLSISPFEYLFPSRQKTLLLRE